jgi:hypothetical protein
VEPENCGSDVCEPQPGGAPRGFGLREVRHGSLAVCSALAHREQITEGLVRAQTTANPGPSVEQVRGRLAPATPSREGQPAPRWVTRNWNATFQLTAPFDLPRIRGNCGNESIPPGFTQLRRFGRPIL